MTTTPPPAPQEPTTPQPSYETAPPAPPAQTPSNKNILGIIGLIVAGLGFIFACIPGALIIGWLLLPVGFVLGLISVFLKDKVKWPGFTAIGVSIVGTIVGFIVFFLVVAVSFDEAFSDSGVELEESTTEVVEEAPAEEQEAEPAAEEGTRENPAPFDTTITTDDWEVSLLSFNPDGNAQVKEWEQYNEDPADGFVYVIVEASATYSGSESTPSSFVEIDYVTPEGNVYATWDSFIMGVEPEFGQAELLDGANDTGYLVFEVPDSVDGLIRVIPGFLSDDEIFLTLP